VDADGAGCGPEPGVCADWVGACVRGGRPGACPDATGGGGTTTGGGGSWAGGGGKGGGGGTGMGTVTVTGKVGNVTVGRVNWRPLLPEAAAVQKPSAATVAKSTPRQINRSRRSVSPPS
jgi:hypothetical protein